MYQLTDENYANNQSSSVPPHSMPQQPGVPGYGQIPPQGIVNPPPVQNSMPPQPGVPGYGQIPPQGRAYPPAGYYPPQPPVHVCPQPTPWKEREEYKAIRSLCAKPRAATLAVLLFLFSVLLSEMVLRSITLCGLGISIPVTVVLFYAIVLWYRRGEAHPASVGAAKWLFIPIGLIALSFTYIQSGLVQAVNLIALCLLVPIHLSLLWGYRPEFGAFSAHSYRRSARTMLTMDCGTLGYLESPFFALRKASKLGKNGRRRFLFTMLGLLFAIPAVALFAVLLASYDAGFAEFIDRTLSFIKEIFTVEMIFNVIIGFGIACLLAPMLYSFCAFSATKEEPLTKPTSKLESAATAAFLIPVVLLHLLFAAYQIFSIISTRGQGTQSVSSVARQSFGALVVALGLGFAMVLVIYFFNRKREDGSIPVFIRFLLTVQILCGFTVLGFAVYHSIRYSLAFGLTVSRISAYWLMAIMGICFIWMLVKIWRSQFRLLHFCSATVVILVLLLNFCNPDVLSAKVNVDRYLSGVAEEIDTKYLATLAPSAVPEITRLLSSDVKEDAVKALEVQRYHLEERKRWSNFSISDITAWNALNRNQITQSVSFQQQYYPHSDYDYGYDEYYGF